MLLVAWKWLIFGPAFLFQISNDVQPRGRRGLVAPKFARLLDAGKVMAQPFKCRVWSAECRMKSEPRHLGCYALIFAQNPPKIYF